MASEAMTDERRANAVTIGDLVIERVEQVVLRVDRIGQAITGFAHKRPISVVVSRAGRTFRFDLDRTDGPGPDAA